MLKNENCFKIILSDINVCYDSIGFYSMLFFVVNHYLYSKKYNMNHCIDSESWQFKHDKGWSDYFQETKIEKNINTEVTRLFHKSIIENFKVSEYIQGIKELYVYNEKTLKEINKVKDALNLKNKNYDSVFIRRGDKLISESKYKKIDEYIELLLKINPECKRLFLQTDDYNVYIEFVEYIQNNNLNIELLCICKESNVGGVYVKKYAKQYGSNFDGNDEYIKKNRENVIKNKAVDEMNSQEIYEHVINMLVGIDIVCNSNICVTDYGSNVGRFVKLFHDKPENVWNVDCQSSWLNYDSMICPSYTF